MFVYGSLMFDEVWGRVVKGRYDSFPATASHLVRLAVPGETYPAAVPLEGASIQGLVWQNVGLSDLERLDAFEGREYTRVSIEVLPVSCAGTNQAMIKPYTAWIYLWKQPELLNSEMLWNVEAFKNEGLPLFLAKHVGSWQQTGVRN
ncbi:MAG: gamma-glutamylcyclotransferase [Limnobacter sp.]|nr:gamma-glutamylcyclotransferase [Limnobacter sp.]